jgi:hypothetical protein
LNYQIACSNGQRSEMQRWMIVLGRLNKVGIEALRIGGLTIRFRTATVIRFVAEMARGMSLGSGANDRAQDRRNEYCDKTGGADPSNHVTAIVGLLQPLVKGKDGQRDFFNWREIPVSLI